MPILVRKINRAKWPPKSANDFVINDLQADAITSCLRTKKNSLSMWEIDNKEELNEAILALELNAEHLDSIDVVVFDKNFLENEGFTIAEEKADGPIMDLNERHRNIIQLNYNSLSKFAYLVMSEIIANREERIIRGQIKDIILKAIEDKRIDISDLNPSLQEKLGA